MKSTGEEARAWDREYVAGRYGGEPPVDFVRDILSHARQRGVHRGLYIGCGNGRNFLRLVEGGLELTGLDISAVALTQLTQRAPSMAHRLVHGDLSALPEDMRFELVIGIQVFQHGTRDAAHAHIRSAQERVQPAGLFAIRVNAVDTDVEYDHEILEEFPDGSYTIRYRDGPKQGLAIHFFSDEELAGLFADDFRPILPLQLTSTVRQPPGRGQWSQWEAIWQRDSPPRNMAV
jgi:SAM-dependent methyltransferase